MYKHSIVCVCAVTRHTNPLYFIQVYCTDLHTNAATGIIAKSVTRFQDAWNRRNFYVLTADLVLSRFFSDFYIISIKSKFYLCITLRDKVVWNARVHSGAVCDI